MAPPVRAARSHYFLAGLEFRPPAAPQLASEETRYVLPSALPASGKTSCPGHHTSYGSPQLNIVVENHVDRPPKTRCCPILVVEQKRARSCLSLAFRSLREGHRLAAFSVISFLELLPTFDRPGGPEAPYLPIYAPPQKRSGNPDGS